MDLKKDAKIAGIVREAVSEFCKRESNRLSLITITRVDMIDHGKKAIAYFTVFPEDKEEEALAFLKRSRSDIYKFMIGNTGLSFVPLIDVEIDIGEKNRQKIEGLRI